MGIPSLFHKTSFLASLEDGSLPKILFFAVIGLSARFSTHPSLAAIHPWDRSRPYVREAEKLLDLHEVSLVTIQACILLAANVMADGEAMTECIYYGIACRIALLLDLPNRPAKTQVEQELNRRVWWSLITTDTWNSTSLSLPRAIPATKHAALPMCEIEFMTLDPNQLAQNAESEASQDLSVGRTPRPILAQFIGLNMILYEIHALNTSIATDDMGQGLLELNIRRLAGKLDAWLANLPPEMQYSEENEAQWVNFGLGSTFINLHLNYNNAGQLLFYISLGWNQGLPHDSLSQGASIEFLGRCKRHAASLCDLTWHAIQKPATSHFSLTVGHLIVVSSTIQIQTLLSSEHPEEISLAKNRLERNFMIITTLHKYWPVLSATSGRLRAFHNACMKYHEAAYRLDRWMLRFILGFQQPISERPENSSSSGRGLEPLDHLWIS
ncbi:hypothetical protein N7522_004434 [Penicillium canescens]|nr:hypothetical protein N7522_004434 [Penicillium canescens]